MPIIRKKKTVSIGDTEYQGPVSDEELLEDSTLTSDQRLMISKSQQGFNANSWLYQAFVPFEDLHKHWEISLTDLLGLCLRNEIPVYAPVNECAKSYLVIDYGPDYNTHQKYSETEIEYPSGSIHQLYPRDLEKYLILASERKYKIGEIRINISSIKPRETDFASPIYAAPIIVRLVNEASVRLIDLGLHGDDVCLVIKANLVEKWREEKIQLQIAENEGLTFDNPTTRDEFLLRLACGYLWSIKEIKYPSTPSNRKIAANVVKAMEMYHKNYKGKRKLTQDKHSLKHDSIVSYISEELNEIKNDYAKECTKLRCDSPNPDSNELETRKWEMTKIMITAIRKLYGKKQKPLLTNYDWDFFDPNNYVDIEPSKK